MKITAREITVGVISSLIASLIWSGMGTLLKGGLTTQVPEAVSVEETRSSTDTRDEMAEMIEPEEKMIKPPPTVPDRRVSSSFEHFKNGSWIERGMYNRIVAIAEADYWQRFIGAFLAILPFYFVLRKIIELSRYSNTAQDITGLHTITGCIVYPFFLFVLFMMPVNPIMSWTGLTVIAIGLIYILYLVVSELVNPSSLFDM